MVDGRVRGVGRREYFQDPAAAKTRAEQLAFNRVHIGIAAAKAPLQQMVMAEHAREILRPFNATILDAAKFYVAHLTKENEAAKSPPIRDVVARFIESRTKDAERGDLSPESVGDLRNATRHLTAAAGDIPINRFGADELRSFLDSFPVSARTRYNIRLRLSGLFTFAKRKGWIAQNPCELVTVKVRRTDVVILNLAESEMLLRCAEASKHQDVLVPYVAIGLFAGLRPFEIQRLDWRDVDFETNYILVRAETSKKRESRYVEMNATLCRWLRPHTKHTGSLIGENFRKQRDAMVKAAGYNSQRPWPQDVMRHTAASNLLAIIQNRALVAEQLGTSIEILRRHYRKPVLPIEAERFFALSPNAASNGDGETEANQTNICCH